MNKQKYNFNEIHWILCVIWNCFLKFGHIHIIYMYHPLKGIYWFLNEILYSIANHKYNIKDFISGAYSSSYHTSSLSKL